VDWEGFSSRLRVDAAPSVPRARRERVEVGSGTSTGLAIIVAFHFSILENSVPCIAGGIGAVSVLSVSAFNTAANLSWSMPVLG
jgi:hypothetical protein